MSEFQREQEELGKFDEFFKSDNFNEFDRKLMKLDGEAPAEEQKKQEFDRQLEEILERETHSAIGGKSNLRREAQEGEGLTYFGRKRKSTRIDQEMTV
mmetsp:Transcript_12254/g.20623  ORF Transcript_12254/g.20623 Transcript_12254/m.20623 type:complete len:98 (+) Transcript_12254:644-937(+)